MRLEDFKRKIISDFNGLYSRGDEDTVPIDHFVDCLNVDYDINDVSTRVGHSSAFALGYGTGIVRRFACIFNPVAIIHLILDNAGNLYTFSNRVGDTATTPLITVVGATDFSALQVNGRIYIAFHDGLTGIPATSLKVYIPNATLASDVIRNAAGSAPTAASAMVAAVGSGGRVNPGFYKIAVVNITTSGFITPPGPKISSVFTPTIYNAPGASSARGTLTAADITICPTEGQTVTIGAITYTFRGSPTIPYDVQLYVSGQDIQLAYLKASINGDISGTPKHTQVNAEDVVVTGSVVTLAMSAIEPGGLGNNIVTTEASTGLAFGSATLTSGANGNKINLSVIPTGPTGTAQRQIIITKANEEEYFFLPSDFGGILNNNTSTTTVLDFDDTVDLLDSADYLFDLLETIPAPVGLGIYSGRLVTWGEDGNTSINRVSYLNDPESFDDVDSIIQISKDDGFVCTNGMEMRGAFYAGKSLGVFTYSDNGDIPANWVVNPVDKSISICSHGISEFFNMSGIRISRDLVYVVDRSGILVFNGTFIKPPLTFKINSLWQRINFAQYKKVTLVVDEQIHKMYCSFPIDSATENDTLIVGDYSACGDVPDSDRIKWSIYLFKAGTKRPTAIGMTAVVGEITPTFKLGSLDGGSKIWKRDITATTDDGTAIESYIELPLLFFADGMIHFFTAIRLRMTGTGNLAITSKGLDGVNSTTIAASIALSTTSGTELLRRFSFTNERIKIKLRLTSGYFELSKIEIFGTAVYQMRPA